MTCQALRSGRPCHKPFLLIGLGEISQFNSERLVLSPTYPLRFTVFGIACHPGQRLVANHLPCAYFIYVITSQIDHVNSNVEAI
jgi:hypothetical protein